MDPRTEAIDLAIRVAKGEIAGIVLVVLPTKDGTCKSAIVGAAPDNKDLLAAIGTSATITLGDWLARRLKVVPTSTIEYGGKS